MDDRPVMVLSLLAQVSGRQSDVREIVLIYRKQLVYLGASAYYVFLLRVVLSLLKGLTGTGDAAVLCERLLKKRVLGVDVFFSFLSAFENNLPSRVCKRLGPSHLFLLYASVSWFR